MYSGCVSFRFEPVNEGMQCKNCHSTLICRFGFEEVYIDSETSTVEVTYNVGQTCSRSVPFTHICVFTPPNINRVVVVFQSEPRTGQNVWESQRCRIWRLNCCLVRQHARCWHTSVMLLVCVCRVSSFEGHRTTRCIPKSAAGLGMGIMEDTDVERE